ncbi:MAG: hypothetical protein JRF33_18040 [Deltaproteobacteria bacterium]|nr:hypothetical protein [Deltaproteobacteria bacterium]
MAGWFERDPEEFIVTMVFLLILLAIGIAFLVSYIRAKRNPVEPKQEKVVRHLLDKGFLVCDVGGMVLWPLDLELEETRALRAIIKDPDSVPEEVQMKLVACYQDKALCGLVSEHVVRFSKKGREMFSIEEGPARVELWVYLDRLNDHLEFPSKLALERHCSADPDDGAKPFDSGHEGFDNFFPNRAASKWAVKVFQSAGDKLDCVTRFASKWAERLDYARISRHIRLGLPAGAVLDAEEPSRVLDELIKDAIELAETLESVLDPSFVSPEHCWVDRPIYARLELLGSCPKCAAGMPLNGPTQSMRCHKCFHEKALGADMWDMLKYPLDDFLQGEGGISTGWGKNSTKLDWRVMVPTCAECGAELPVDSVEVGTTGVVRCTGCEAETPTCPPPAWLVEAAPGLEQLYAAEGMSETTDGKALEVDQDANKPIGMTCPGCAGGLMTTVESERTITCEYCGLEVFLPDALWQKLHPAKATKAWWARYAAPLPPDGSEDQL